MGKTYKKYPRNNYGVRTPRGFKNRVLNSERGDGIEKIQERWIDDCLPVDKQCLKIVKIAIELHKKGRSIREIINHLVKKFNLTHNRVSDIISREYVDEFFWRCQCVECNNNRYKYRWR